MIIRDPLPPAPNPKPSAPISKEWVAQALEMLGKFFCEVGVALLTKRFRGLGFMV